MSKMNYSRPSLARAEVIVLQEPRQQTAFDAGTWLTLTSTIDTAIV